MENTMQKPEPLTKDELATKLAAFMMAGGLNETESERRLYLHGHIYRKQDNKPSTLVVADGFPCIECGKLTNKGYRLCAGCYVANKL